MAANAVAAEAYRTSRHANSVLYLPREAISAELAQTCEELRRFVDERGQRQQRSRARRRSRTP